MLKQFLIIACTAICFSSCVKIHECECTTTKNGAVIDTDMTEYPGTKKLTKQMCQDRQDDLDQIKFDEEEVIECTHKS